MIVKQIRLWFFFTGVLASFAVANAERFEIARLPSTSPSKRPLAYQPSTESLQYAEFDYPPDGDVLTRPLTGGQAPPANLKELMRPRYNLGLDWEPEVDALEMSSFDLSIRVPTYPFFGPPPPMISGGYSVTRINAPASFDLPSILQEFTLGMGWMRRMNEQWMARLMLSGAFASDLDHTGSDAWQVRAGGFAMYRPNDRWTFAFGALATGRDDLPVLPAIGAIWEPSPEWKVNLMMPNPRVSKLLLDSGSRQHWGYLGGSIAGGTWAYERASGGRDRISYGEFRIALGWESKPPQPPGTFTPIGRTFSLEVGYVFGREFEFDSSFPDISIGDTMGIRIGMTF